MSETRSSVLRVEEPGAKYLDAAESGLMRSFQELATAPRGVARLRELVLAMAVRGRLTTRSDADGSVDVLLDEIGRLRKLSVRVSAGEEVPFALPTHWRWVKLGELGRVVGGGTPKSGDTSMWAVAGHSWLTPADLYGLKVKAIGRGRRDISIRGLNESSAQLLPTGTVLFSSRAPIGYVAIAANPLATNQGFKSCVLHISEVGDYLYWYLKHAARSIDAVASGTTFKEISGAQFARIWVPLPPLAEQHRIVARVEELMKLCDALEQSGRLANEQHARLMTTLFEALAASESAHALAENWRLVAEHFDLLLDRPEAIDTLEQTIFELAVRGLLVPQDSRDETASESLAKIRAEKELTAGTRRIKCELPSLDIGETVQPFALPAGWAWARFPEVGEFGRGKSKHRPRNDPRLFNPGIYPLIQTGEVARAGQFITEVHSYYSDAGLAQSRLWPAGTLCITIAANIADSAILGFDACFPDSVVGFIPAKALGDARYFLIFMQTARQRLVDFAPATAQKNINLDVLSNVLIPLPPVAEQVRVVARVEELLRLCADLRQRLTQALSIQSRLADTLLAEVE